MGDWYGTAGVAHAPKYNQSQARREKNRVVHLTGSKAVGRCLEDLCLSHGLSYGTGRQIAGKVKKDIESDLRNVYEIVMSDIER